jgi:hypothetical protein
VELDVGLGIRHLAGGARSTARSRVAHEEAHGVAGVLDGRQGRW